MDKVDYSLFIKTPSPDIPTDGREVFNATIAIRDIDAMMTIGFQVDGVPLMPSYIVDFFRQAILAGHYRVELLVGVTEYKLYRKVHKEEKAPFMVINRNEIKMPGTIQLGENTITLFWTVKQGMSILDAAQDEEGAFMSREAMELVYKEILALGWKESEHSRK